MKSVAQMEEYFFAKKEVTGSTPVAFHPHKKMGYFFTVPHF